MDRGTVEAILSQHIAFVPGGDRNNLRAKCPFHKGGAERDGSFYVYVGPTVSAKKRTGSAFCHTCGEGWSFSTLLRRLGSSSEYVDAAVAISEEYKPPAKSRIEPCFDTPKLPEHILGVFDYCPMVLLEAGFSKETLKEFDIGFDNSTNRITFPIRDHHGALVGISGRSSGGPGPRYKIYEHEFNSIMPGYHLDKSRIVWGLDRFYTTSMHCALKYPVVICEGFKAAMWVAQGGFPHTVCLLGGYCSLEQRTLIERVTDRVVLFMDDDAPGKQFTEKLVTRLSESLIVTVAKYPTGSSGLSPDDLDNPSITIAVTEAEPSGSWLRRINEQHIKLPREMERV